jgi:hypothetical protein
MVTAGTERVRVLSNGNVGIGTTSPGAKLDVNGNLKVHNIQLDESFDYDDTILFAPQAYFEAQSPTAPANWIWDIDGFEKVNNTDSPFSQVAKSSSYDRLYSDYIPVNPGDRLYGEIWAMRPVGATGTAGTLYYGIERYDKDKRPIATNQGCTYFVASGVTVPTDGIWHKYSGYTTLPLSHTPYGSPPSDGGPVRYVRVRILVDYSAGTIPTYWGGITLRRVEQQRDLGDVAFNGNVGIGTTSPAQKLHVAGNVRVDGAIVAPEGTLRDDGGGWVRTYGNTGWYSQTYGGGWYMTDTTWIRSYGNKNIYQNTGILRTDGTLQVGSSGGTLNVVNGGNFAYRANVLFANTAGNVGIGTTSPSQQLEITGDFEIPNTTYADQSGIIYKGSTPFIHNFNYGNNGTVTTLGYNTFVGVNAGNLTMGSTATQTYHASYNSAMGYNALYSNTTGYHNSAMGFQALCYNTTGHHNSAMGYYALRSNTTGYNNSAMGVNALYSNTTGSYNSAMGYYALRLNTTGYSNSAMGVNALYSNTTGSDNSAMGYNALSSNITGFQNSAMGVNALQNNTTGYSNSAMGMYALYSNTTGSNNSAMGVDALYSNTTGYSNSAMGVDALRSNTIGYSNSAMGMQALFSNTTGYQNSAMGMYALSYNTTGSNNSAMGTHALSSNTTGSNNSAMGMYALRFNTTGSYNSAMGMYALYSNTTGSYNSAMGMYALYSNTTGNYNSAMGTSALYKVKPTSKAITAFADNGGGTVKATSFGHGLTGTVASIKISGTTNYNGVYTVTVIDANNFYFTDTWVANDATGWWSKDTEGRYNTALGYQAGDNITTGSNNIIIGANIDAPSATGDNQLNIGNTIYGDLSSGKIGIGTTSPSEKLTVYNGSTTGTYTTSGWVHSSDARLKTNVGFIENPLSKVLALQGVYFNWKNNPDSDRQIGLIAQETLKVVPEVVIGNEDEGYGIAYGNLSALLIEAIKEQQDQFISYQSSTANKFSTINNSITHLDLSFKNLDLRMSDYDNTINRLTLETAYNSIKTANLENSVFRQNRDMQTENLYDFLLDTKEATTSLSDSKFGEEGFSGIYTGEGEYQEIILQLEDGDDLSNLENSKGFLEYEIYLSDADIITDYHTELGNEMDEDELQWDKENHPYFIDGWNKVSLLVDDATETGEVDWADVDYFRTYFKFSGNVEIKIRKLAFRAYERPVIQTDDYFAIDLENYNLTDQLDQAKAIKVVVGQAQTNRQAIEEWKQSQEEELTLVSQTIADMNDFDQMILDVVNSHEERIAVLEGQVAALLGGEDVAVFSGAGYFSLDSEGNLVADQAIKTPAIETQTVSAAEYKLKESQDQPTANGNAGSVIIYTGQQEVFVANDKVMYNSKIIVTPVGSNPVNWVVSEKTNNQGFKIRLSEPAGFDIAFDYWIIEVE